MLSLNYFKDPERTKLSHAFCSSVSNWLVRFLKQETVGSSIKLNGLNTSCFRFLVVIIVFSMLVSSWVFLFSFSAVPIPSRATVSNFFFLADVGEIKVVHLR